LAERARRLVVGLGNPDRGDDGAGRVVARRLLGRLPADVAVIEHDGEATGLLAQIEGADAVYLVDACASGLPAGGVRRLDASAAPLPEFLSDISTHGLGLAAAVELARALGVLPRRCVVYVIEGASFAAGAGLSPAVAAAVDEAAERLAGEIRTPERAGHA
jgi:hydrogenase maturation protease